MRAAIIGTGGIARSHVAALRGEPERVELVAAMDIDPERVRAFRETHGIAGAYTDVGAMLAAERPGLVTICTPPATHADLIVQALEAGAWVLCEKPLCASLAELDRIEEAERRTGRYCASVVQWRFGSAARHLQGLIAAGALGRPLVGLCNTVWFRDAAYYAVPWRGKWATELGGATMGQGIHAIDLFLWTLGDWAEVRAMIGTLDRAIEVEDVSMAIVRFAGGAMGSIVNSVLSPRQESYVRFDFARATVELRHLYRYSNRDWTLTLPDGADNPDLLAAWEGIPGDTPSSHGAQLAALLDDLARGARPSTSGPGIRGTIEFITSLYKSALTGRPVVRGSITPDDPFYRAMNGRGA